MQINIADLEFEVDKVFFRVSPMKGVIRIAKRNKLDLKYVRPFEILDRIIPVAYSLVLPTDMERIHNVFHVSHLRGYVTDPDHVISYRSLQIQEDMSYTKEPVQNLDCKEKQLRSKIIFLIKVLWRSQHIEDAIWELEDEMRKNYPHLFQGTLIFEDEISVRRVEL